MSFIEKIIKKIKPEQARSQKDKNMISYTIPLGIDEQVLEIVSLNKIQDFKHSNNEITTLYYAQAYHVNSSTDTVIFGLLNEKNLLFELPQGTQINNVIMQKIGSYYMYDINQPKDCNYISYIGRLTQDPNDYQVLKSAGVQKYINDYVVPKIKERRENIKKNSQRQNIEMQEAAEKRNKEYRERARGDQIKYEEEQARRKRDRINNPYLAKVHERTIDGKKYSNYDGINLNTGEILRLREVDKVGKDEYGTYLYSCYINNTENRHDAEMLNSLNGPLGKPVMFISDKKIEDVIYSENPSEINEFLKFLSKVNTKTGIASSLDYIGGFFNGKEDENADSKLSPAINEACRKLREQYKTKYASYNNRQHE